MAYSTSQYIVQALVQEFRSNSSLRSSLVGGLHEGFASESLDYPFGVYVVVAAPLMDDHTGRMTVMLVDVTIYSRNQVEASNLDQAMSQTLDGASLTVTGQSSLICYRVADLRSTDVDEEGQKVYGVGGSYEIWTDQKPT
jgi:hypothetical protein